MENITNQSLYSLLAQIIRLHKCCEQTVFEKLHIYPGHPALFHFLAKEDGLSQSELATKLRRKASTIATMLKRLEKAGCVERKKDPRDGRIIRVHLTDTGRVKYQQAIEQIHILEKDYYAGFTDEEMIILRRLLMQISDNLDEVVICEK